MDEGFLRDYVDALARRDRAGAIGVVTEAVARGVDPVDVVCDLLVPAQRLVGERWFANEFTVADEHLATAISEAALGYLDSFDVPTSGEAIVLACPATELHAFGPRIAAFVLRRAGFEVFDLGASVPTSHLLRFVEEADPAWVGLSAALAPHLRDVSDVIRALQERFPDLKVVLGGRASGLTDAGWVGADRIVADVREMRGAA